RPAPRPAPPAARPLCSLPRPAAWPGPARNGPRRPRRRPDWTPSPRAPALRLPRAPASAVQLAAPGRAETAPILLWPAPGAGLAAGLLLDADVGDDGGGIDGLDHVDQRERGDGDRSQRLHLHPGPVRGADRRGDLNGAVADLEVDRDRVDRDRMAER